MSGGHFDHLYIKDTDDLITHEHQLERMVTDLATLGYAEDAAREADELLCIVRQYRVRAETRQQRLYGVFRAMEYWRSSDSSEEGVKKALAAYRTEKTDAD